MAAEFENMGRLHREGKHETETRQCMDFAMITYAALSRISCNSPESEKYCDMAQLKMAGIYADLNQPDRAEAVYKEILNRNSRSADAIYNLGLLYEKTEQWENALNIWRKFSDGVKKGTSPWFESRYKTAYALSRLGDNAKACEILNITLVLHSDLGSDELKAKYLSLKAKICKGEPS
jgi:tetratricopeptide (TPR) repeat protein